MGIVGERWGFHLGFQALSPIAMKVVSAPTGFRQQWEEQTEMRVDDPTAAAMEDKDWADLQAQLPKELRADFGS